MSVRFRAIPRHHQHYSPSQTKLSKVYFRASMEELKKQESVNSNCLGLLKAYHLLGGFEPLREMKWQGRQIHLKPNKET